MYSIFSCCIKLTKKDKEEINKKRIQILPEYKKLAYMYSISEKHIQ